jgi:DNA polymerase-4
MKTIMHVDMNSYFATVEQQTNPNLRGKPVGIIKAEGRGCVIAASVEAKKFGVKTGSTTWEARLKCPQTIFVPADMDKYLSITNKFIDILSEYSPSVEIFSIDELFMDISDVLTLYPGGRIQMAWEIKHKIKKILRRMD